MRIQWNMSKRHQTNIYESQKRKMKRIYNVLLNDIRNLPGVSSETFERIGHTVGNHPGWTHDRESSNVYVCQKTTVLWNKQDGWWAARQLCISQLNPVLGILRWVVTLSLSLSLSLLTSLQYLLTATTTAGVTATVKGLSYLNFSRHKYQQTLFA